MQSSSCIGDKWEVPLFCWLGETQSLGHPAICVEVEG
jgi:hypothetical protein